MAESLIEKKTSEFDAQEFENRYIDALKALIAEKQKKKGKRVIQDDEPDKPSKGSNVIDLMAALKKSLGDEKPKAKPVLKKGTAKPAARRTTTKKAAPKRAAGGRRR
jgi:DNA end-binding protein Ku